MNLLKYVNRRFVGIAEASNDLKELHERNVPLAAIEPEHIIEFRTWLGACLKIAKSYPKHKWIRHTPRPHTGTDNTVPAQTSLTDSQSTSHLA